MNRARKAKSVILTFLRFHWLITMENSDTHLCHHRALINQKLLSSDLLTLFVPSKYGKSPDMESNDCSQRDMHEVNAVYPISEYST